MAYTINDALTSLAYRLGESQTPTATAEVNRRLTWVVDGLKEILKDRPFWFLQKITTAATVANTPNYTFPTDFRKEIQIYVDGYKYDKILPEEIDDYRTNLQPVQMLTQNLKYKYYTLGGSYYLIPTPSSAPTAKSVTITSSGTTATVTHTSHGWATNDYVTIAGANESAYNGKFKITKTSANAYTYTMASDPADTATGTITATKDNIEIWHFYEPTIPTATTDSIIIPDKYMNILVAFAEGRYWSTAHSRGKSADAFAEFETGLEQLRREDTRRNFTTGNYRLD
jgi:hypothetical protein